MTMEEKDKKETKVSEKKQILKEAQEKQKKFKKTRKKKKLTQADIKKYPMTELDHVILKIKANETKYTIISVIIILLVFFMVIFMVSISVQKKDKYNTLRDEHLVIKFRERENGLGNIVDLVDTKKYSDSKKVLDTYRVTITNDSEDAHKFKIFIKDDKEMIELDNCQDIFLNRSFLRYSINNGKTFALGDNEDSIIFGTLSPYAKVTYDIKVWVSDTYLDDPHYHGKIIVKQIVDKEKDS